MDPKLLEALSAATTGQNVLFVRLGDVTILVPMKMGEPVDPASIQSLGIEDLVERDRGLMLACSQLVADLLPPEQRAALEAKAMGG